MPSIIQEDKANISDIYKGGLMFLIASHSSQALCEFAINIVEEIFESKIEDINTSNDIDVQLFISKAKKCKNIFTNDEHTKKLLKDLIRDRYKLYQDDDFLFDVPRLRIVPNSNFLSSGISYNYKPHRDTWYGAGQDQLNHWMAVSNVTENSTFYIAPSYFSRKISNNSEIFDLDEWDTKYRPQAEANVGVEVRPHPVPLDDLDMDDRSNIVLPRGSEVAFSGQHLHGSSPNTTSFVRFSIDYRVCPAHANYINPKNIDNKASGNYKKYMLPVG